jgi:hypothetical protein
VPDKEWVWRPGKTIMHKAQNAGRYLIIAGWPWPHFCGRCIGHGDRMGFRGQTLRVQWNRSDDAEADTILTALRYDRSSSGERGIDFSPSGSADDTDLNR